MNKLFTHSLLALTLAIFVALVPILFISHDGTTLVWTILIPLMPIGLLIIGFSRWRDVCPLAFISKISQSMNFIKKRKVPAWFEENFWYFQYAFLFIALTLRLIILNEDNQLLAYFFIVVILAAFFTNLFFTGKSWCNFLCPVGTVEKIYTISNAKNYILNSACSTCTACKKNCPDIDLESNYWKEGNLNQKTFVFYSFAGMVLGFYLYFYLQSGSFTYYFEGTWTQDKITPFSNGFFFAPYIPTIIAVPFTLAFFSYLSYFLFQSLEKYLWKKQFFKNVNQETNAHRVKTFASFVAFNIFYIFAGAPAYHHYPIAYAVFYFAVVSISSILFYKEIFREEAYFIQERFALKLIKRWKSTKVIPSNLKEIYYTYINENKSQKERLKAYKNSIIDLMQDGILNEGSMKVLDKLRDQIGISNRDHNSVMQLIKLNNQHLFDDSIDKSAEKRYQQNSYKEVIESALDEHREIDAGYLKSLQKQFCISDDVHKEIMDKILNTNEKITGDILNLLEHIHKLIKLRNSIVLDGTREINFLKYSIKNEFKFTSKNLFSILFTIYKDNKKTLKVLLNMAKGKEIDASFVMNAHTLSFMHETISSKMLEVHKDFFADESRLSPEDNKEIIKTLLYHESIQISVAALLNTKFDTKEYLTEEILERFCNTNDIEIQSLLYKLKYKTQRITTYERMMYLNSIPLFNNLKFNDLHVLGQCTKVVHFESNSYIIKQGAIGKTLYVLIKGAAIVEIDDKEVAKVGHREYFGEIAILGDTTRTASVKVTIPTTALTITKKDFKHFLQHNPKVSIKVMKEIIKKLL